MCSAVQENQRATITDYLDSIIHEEIEHAIILKERMKLPVQYPQLLGLASRCNVLLENDMTSLKQLSKQLSSSEVNLRYVWRSVRNVIREIEWTEKYGIPALYYQTEEVGFLNTLMFRIVQEANLPLQPPAVACLSTSYYYTAP